MVDGNPSRNIVAMQSFLPTESWDFFGAELTNRVAEFDLNDNT